MDYRVLLKKYIEFSTSHKKVSDIFTKEESEEMDNLWHEIYPDYKIVRGTQDLDDVGQAIKR